MSRKLDCKCCCVRLRLMKKTERAENVMRILNKQYPETPIPLNHTDTFTLLIAVLLSAQCTDDRVNQITPSLFSMASDPETMAKLTEKQIYDVVKPCGLGPQKSKAIKELSAIIADDYGGLVPGNFIELERLPGVGHKTASVVMSQGFGIPAFAVDTHIHRLSQRWGLTNGHSVTKTERDLKKIFPERSWNKLHLQIIFWGRQYCKARECFGLQCEICRACYPNRKKPLIHKRP